MKLVILICSLILSLLIFGIAQDKKENPNEYFDEDYGIKFIKIDSKDWSFADKKMMQENIKKAREENKIPAVVYLQKHPEGAPREKVKITVFAMDKGLNLQGKDKNETVSSDDLKAVCKNFAENAMEGYNVDEKSKKGVYDFKKYTFANSIKCLEFKGTTKTGDIKIFVRTLAFKGKKHTFVMQIQFIDDAEKEQKTNDQVDYICKRITLTAPKKKEK